MMIKKTAAMATATFAQKVTEATATAIQEIREASSSVTTSVARITETTLTYKDALMKAASQTCHSPTSHPTTNSFAVRRQS